MNSLNPLISIVIPTKNGEATIRRCLTGIINQTYKKIEVIIVDSSSTDKTLEIASKFPCVTIYNISESDFNHGTTRNFAVSKAKGDYILMTVQDAYPVNDNLIENMLKHFTDSDVVGVCGQQVVPHENDKNPHEWFRPVSQPTPKTIYYKDRNEFNSLKPKELIELCGWDNVNAMYRRNVILDYPFPNVSFGEDMAWAKIILKESKKIIYDYRCRVYHYHHASYEYAYKRALTTLYFKYKHFKYIPKYEDSFLIYLKIIYRNIKNKYKYEWIKHNIDIQRATTKAYNDFLSYQSAGDEALDYFHSINCGIAPQGAQNNSPY